ncbi:substrate-binding periplasmic protein [Aliirhizobium smilacinae]|uniref:Transporter substrate-binding domain-containing protein n=1 Tax=Aliirhizobium smilacinae TaxID=1395944 RepID=A0A5C4XJ82_9HYPH|nr:transporter substrate-binding domain-containing protein [Rhizobium smilacinae]TNM63001.1 transporter substrate-binding domain-containing protein [Rhizobium smilacinae]
MKMTIALICMLGLGSPALAQSAVTLTTESYPPFIYRNPDGTYHGSSVEQVEALMRNAGIPFTMEIMPWARAITLAETQPMHCVFSTARIPEREKRFKWVTPLSISRHVLVRLAGSGVTAKTLEEAKRYTIGTHRADFTETLLRERDFPSIDLSSDFEITLNKLLEQRVDMMPMSDNIYERLKSEGKPIEIVLPFSESHFGIACNKQMPDDLISRMQNGLDALISEKGQDEILQRYGLKPLRLWEK